MTTASPAARRFELIGKHKSTITSIDILSLKMGQTEVRPAVCVSFKTSMPNKEVLPMFGARLLPFCYENTGRNTGALDGFQAVTDVPNLTAEAIALGPLDYEYEQTGCVLIVYEGNSKRTLKGGTVRKVKLDNKEGGTTDTYWQFYTAEDVDDEVIGHLGVLKSLERDVELTAPEIVSQQRDIEEDETADPGLTPEKALATALQQQHEGKDVTVKPPPRKTPIAKKIARAVGKQSRRAKA